MPKQRPLTLPTPYFSALTPDDIVSFRVPGADYTRHHLGRKIVKLGITYLHELATNEMYLARRCKILQVWRGLELVACVTMPATYYKNLDWPPSHKPYEVVVRLDFPVPDRFEYQHGDMVEYQYKKHHHTARGFIYEDGDGLSILRRRAKDPIIPLTDVTVLRVWRRDVLVAQVRVAEPHPFVVHDRKASTVNG